MPDSNSSNIFYTSCLRCLIIRSLSEVVLGDSVKNDTIWIKMLTLISMNLKGLQSNRITIFKLCNFL